MFQSKDTAPPKCWYIHIILVKIDEKDVHAEWCCFAKFSQTAVSRDMQAYAYRTHAAKPMRDLQAWATLSPRHVPLTSMVSVRRTTNPEVNARYSQWQYRGDVSAILPLTITCIHFWGLWWEQPSILSFTISAHVTRCNHGLDWAEGIWEFKWMYRLERISRGKDIED